MIPLVELETVECTKDLVPNLPVLTRALFGPNAQLIDWRRIHTDLAAGMLKYSDGMVWLPWLGQLWLVGVAGKERSEFFRESRTFAKGKIDSQELARELKTSFGQMEPALGDATHGIRKEDIADKIVQKTMENHLKTGFLVPHGWIIMGHCAGDMDKLRGDYQTELDERFNGDQQYILSVARMFQSEASTYILMEQHCSLRCSAYARVNRSVLVEATSSGGR